LLNFGCQTRELLNLVGELGKDKVIFKIKDLERNNIDVNIDNIKAIVLRTNDKIDNDEIAINILGNYDLLYDCISGGEAIWILK